MTTKLQKIWKLTDQITNLEQVFNCRDDACDFEHSDTFIEQGYFITAKELKDELESFFICGYNLADKADTFAEFRKLIKDRFQDLGVEDD